MAKLPDQPGERSAVKTLVCSSLVAGSLDILAAILVFSLILKKIPAVTLLQSIASGIFGKKAYDGGIEMALYGLAFHFLIAFIFATFYFLVFPYFTFLKKHVFFSGILYGIFIWCVMNLAVVPTAFQRRPHITLESLIQNVIILMLMVGLPISYITHKFSLPASD